MKKQTMHYYSPTLDSALEYGLKIGTTVNSWGDACTVTLAREVERLRKIETAAKDFVAVIENEDHWDIRQYDKALSALKEVL